MGISGFEAILALMLSPALLAIRPVREFILQHLCHLHVISLAGVAAYLIKDPAFRLLAVGLGVGASCLGWVASLYADAISAEKLESKVVSWGMGLILLSTVKFIWQTNNPIWPIMHAENGGWNGVGLFLATLAAFRFTRKPHAVVNVYVPPDSRSTGSAVLAGLGIGGLFFGLHSLLSDSSTMISWVWEGFPVKGPLAMTHGWLTVVAMTTGLALGVLRPNLAGSRTVFCAGSMGVAILTLCPNWTGFYGAITTAVYLMAAATPLLTNASRNASPGATFGIAFLGYIFLKMLHVWVVAYAFVPGGPLVREHTDWINILMMVMIGCGVMDLFMQRRSHTNVPRKVPYSQVLHRKYLAIMAVLINICFLCAAFQRFPTNDYEPYHPEHRLITTGIWTIHFGLDNFMWSSEKRMAELLRELQVDVVGLLESDLQRIIMGNRDVTQYLSEELGMYVDYGPGPNKHTWGAALLSKFPIINSTHHLLPSPVGELAPAIHATIEAYGELVDIFVFHSGQAEDPGDRRLQSDYMAKLMGSTPRPAVLLSYLVTRPHKGNYHRYVSKTSDMHDVDPSDWDRWCEYILFKHLRRVGYARVSRGTITDTELQVAKFMVPKPQDKEKVASWEQDHVMRNRRLNEHGVPTGWRFPDQFQGDGVRGHRYHVFGEPRYYF